MKTTRTLSLLALAVSAAFAATGVELKNGAEFALADIPAEAKAQLPYGGAIRFLLEENATTGYQWTADFGAGEVDVSVEHRAAEVRPGFAGAPGRAAVLARLKGTESAPVFIELKYRRSWEKDVPPAKAMRVILYKVKGGVANPNYPPSKTLARLRTECENRGIVITDWHLHIRGGMTPELAAERERNAFVRSSAMENHGREWEIFDNARLRAFAADAKKVTVNGHRLPVGIQVNDRDWFRQIDAETRARFDYILADTMIMGKLPNGRDNRLWLVKDAASIGDPEKWMEAYMKHNLQILDEPISILANPTYLPAPLDAMADRLWTEERMTAIIKKAVARGIALEIQAESPYPRPAFLKLAKKLGAKFTFGTNNFDCAPKDLSRWLEAILWLDLQKDDIWQPQGASQK